MVDQTGEEPPKYDWQTPKPQFDVGRVLNRTFSAIKYNFVKFMILSFLVAGLPMFLLALWPLFLNGGEGLLSEDALSEGVIMGGIVASILGFVVFMVLSILLQSVLVHACFKDFAGEKVSLKTSSRVAVSFLLPIIGLTILYILGVGIGFLLFVIPGIFLLLGWYLAIPILLVEKLSVTDALSRSWELTKGYKRWILLVVIILMIISMVVSAVLTVASVPFGDPNTAMLTGGTTLFWIIYALATGLGQAISVLINASAVAAIYYEIRDLKEGITPMSIASVFD